MPDTPENKKENKNIAENISAIANEIQYQRPEIPWWTSRTIVSNIVVIVVAILAVFGLQIQISEETITLILAAVSLLNILIRKTSFGSKISSSLLPKKQEPPK